MTGGVAKYVTVREHLGARVAEMAVGERLPAEPALCQEYQVSRITLRRAVEDLMREGVLARHQGRGTFVTAPPLPQLLRENLSSRVTGFYRQQTEAGNVVMTTVLAQEIVHDLGMAERLEVEPGRPLLHLERTRHVNGRLHQHIDTWLDHARFPGTAEHDFTVGSLFEYLESQHGVVLARNELLIKLVPVAERPARALGLTVGAPVLAMDSTVWGIDGTVVAHGTTVHAPEFAEIAVSLQRQLP